MKFVVYAWAPCCHKDLERLGFSHNQVIDADIFETAKKFYDTGLNVMIWHTVDIPVLAVDTKRFNQR